MANKKILVLPGDGIGRKVCDAALPALDALNLPIDLTYSEIGWECWTKEGTSVPQTTWGKIAQVDAILLGAITSKTKKQAEQELPPALQGKNHEYVSPVIQLRQRLDLFANVRPSFYIAGSGKPYRVSVIRETTEGLYAGYDYRGVPETFRPLIKHPNLGKYGYEAASCTLRLQTKLGVQRHYGKQCGCMLAAIKDHFPAEVRLTPPRGGMFVWCELPVNVNTTELLAEAVAQQVTFVPGEYFCVQQPRTHTLRLSFATTPPDKIGTAIKVLGQLIAKRMVGADTSQCKTVGG